MESGDDFQSDDMMYSYQQHIPQCNEESKPYVGRLFPTLDDGIQFYRMYALNSGFDVRLGPIKRSKSGIITLRYVLCNREGEKTVASGNVENDIQNSIVRRRRLTTRVSCMARVIFRHVDGHGYVIAVFNESHSHPMVSEHFKHFMKCNRNLNSAHKNFVLNCARANIGPMKSFRLFKELVGSYENVGCTSTEFKNFSRDLRAFAVGFDAQILLDKFHNKREICDSFKFQYFVDESDKLRRLFWADPIMIEKYDAFGDAVSFDATYATNRYNMIFVPFTGKDNHGRCITFRAGLISNEDVESYSWVFQKFIECMGKEPRLIITDQDPAMRIAIERVLPNTRHRFCMWHITLKVADKLPVRIRHDEEFKKKFDAIVWSEILEPLEFEGRWTNLMEEYGLIGDNWFNAMFAVRNYWIPAYFRKFHMSGLFRTTSMSESENSFFRRYFNSRSNLVVFYMHFESGIDAQRDASDRLCSVDESAFPKLRTDLHIERHAASLYTNSKFIEVQDQITSASFACSIVHMMSGTDEKVYVVDDNVDGKFTVTHNVGDSNTTCSCTFFTRHGMLCCHIFCIFKNMRVSKIPKKYIVGRWTKFAGLRKKEYFTHGTNQLEDQVVVSQLYTEAHTCIGLVDGDAERMKELLHELQTLRNKYNQVSGSNLAGASNVDIFEGFYESSQPDQVVVFPPDPVKTKGSGSRLKSRKEKEIQRKSKPKRRCSKCKQLGSHDARNCDQNVSEDLGS